jgi:hypothetical protein
MVDWPTSANRRIPPVGSSGGVNPAGSGLINRLVVGVGDGVTTAFVLAAAGTSSLLLPNVVTPTDELQISIYLDTVLQPNAYESLLSGSAIGTQTTAGETTAAGTGTILRQPYVWAIPGYTTFALALAASNADWDASNSGITTAGVALYFVEPPPDGVKILLISHI